MRTLQNLQRQILCVSLKDRSVGGQLIRKKFYNLATSLTLPTGKV